MAQAPVNIERWIQEKAAAAPELKDRLGRFAREWAVGALENPLLFPSDQTPGQWEEHLDWFSAVDSYSEPDVPPETRPRSQPRPAAPVPNPAEASRTVMLDSSSLLRPVGAQTAVAPNVKVQPRTTADQGIPADQVDLDLEDLQTMTWKDD